MEEGEKERRGEAGPDQSPIMRMTEAAPLASSSLGDTMATKRKSAIIANFVRKRIGGRGGCLAKSKEVGGRGSPKDSGGILKFFSK